MSKRLLLGFALTLTILSAPKPSRGIVELGIDAFYSAMLGLADEISLRSRTNLFLDFDKIAFGPVVYLEPQHSYLLDYIAGAGVRYGKDFYGQLDGGYYVRRFDGTQGRGYAASLSIGKNIGKVFRIVLPITVKRIETGLAARWIVDYMPYLGVRLRF